MRTVTKSDQSARPSRTIARLAAVATVAVVTAPALAAAAPAGTFTSIDGAKASPKTATSWFHDPVSRAKRHTEVSYTSRAAARSHATRHTTATDRTHSGSIAVPASWAKRHQLTHGQAVVLTTHSLFTKNGRTLSRHGKTTLRRLNTSLRVATALTCEGYTDYGRHAAKMKRLSKAEAATVCTTIHTLQPVLRTHAVGYGQKHPVVVGGTAQKRRANARVIVRVTTSSTAPTAPHLSSARAGSGEATLTFTSPRRTHGAPVTSYQASANGGAWKTLTVTTANPHVATLSKLTNGKKYAVRVRARNKAGASRASNALSVTPKLHIRQLHIVPSSPSITSVDPGDQSATITFSAPTSSGNSPITGYQVSTDGGASWTALSSDGSNPLVGTVSGLTNGTTYVVEVRAVNANGHSFASNAISVTPGATAVAPSAPSLTSASPGDSAATITFAPPTSNGGSAITGYEASTDGGSSWSAISPTGTTSLTDTITGLTNGTTYTVAVRADNSVGHSLTSNTLEVTPAAAQTTASAPRDTQADPGNGSATMLFEIPASNGGSPITGYVATLDGGVTWFPVSPIGIMNMSFTVPGLTNGVTYEMAVRAVTAAGYGAMSPVIPVTPEANAVLPDAPTLTSVQGLLGGTLGVVAFANFTAPDNDGGATITSYEISIDGGTTWQPFLALGLNPYTSLNVTLTIGTTYHFAIRAGNSVGYGPSSNVVAYTPTISI